MNNKKITNSSPAENEPKMLHDEDFAASAERKRKNEAESLSRLIEEAKAKGKEEFDAEKVFNLYYPNDLTDDEAKIMKRAESCLSDYYHSDAMTIEEWVKKREEIEAQGDS